MTITQWNKNRSVGERAGFSITETQAIYRTLKHKPFELCLFCIALDTMLRASDILKLRVRDIQNADGTIRERITIKQQKTRFPVYPILTSNTIEACKRWIAHSNKHANDYLFSSKFSKPITAGWYRTLVKRWASAIDLSPEHYSTHSLRRTKALYLYHVKKVDIQHIAQLLGHNTTDATNRYLRLDISKAQQLAIDSNILTEHEHHALTKSQASSPAHQSLKSDHTDALIDELIALLKSKHSKHKG